MTGLPFPRYSPDVHRPNHLPPPPPGHPERANACKCLGGPLVFSPEDECARCGRYPMDTIITTWQQRAQMLARKANGRRIRDARRRRRKG